MLPYSDRSKICFLLFFLISFGRYDAPVQSQNIKDLVKKQLLADGYFNNMDYLRASKLYMEIYNTDSSDVQIPYKLGLCLFNLKNKRDQSLQYFESSAKGNINESYYYLGKLNHLNLKFEDAIKAYHQYQSSVGPKKFSNTEIDKLIGDVRNAMKMMNNPVNVTIENMGEIINSEFPDYVPLISADESVLIFTSRRIESTGNLLDPHDEYFEDIYISYKENSSWTKPGSISSNINTNTHDACVALSASGEKLIIYRTNKELTSGDLYETIFDGKDWTLPEKLGSDINTEKTTEASASLSADESILYFSSNRPGGYGGMDLYKVVKLPNDKWSKASNLGPAINTAYDEDAPFIHPDQKTLYFSSKGHETMGGYDIFKTEILEDGSWSSPENIGFPINTVEDDIYFVISAKAGKGYYSSNKSSGYGATDIYLVNIPDEDKRLSIVKGLVLSYDSLPLSATITLIDDANKQVQGIYNTNSLTGKFLLVFGKEKIYKMLVEVDGYYPNATYIYSSSQSSEREKNIKMVKKNKK